MSEQGGVQVAIAVVSCVLYMFSGVCQMSRLTWWAFLFAVRENHTMFSAKILTKKGGLSCALHVVCMDESTLEFACTVYNFILNDELHGYVVLCV